jgi:hypothetical protein
VCHVSMLLRAHMWDGICSGVCSTATRAGRCYAVPLVLSHNVPQYVFAHVCACVVRLCPCTGQSGYSMCDRHTLGFGCNIRGMFGWVDMLGFVAMLLFGLVAHKDSNICVCISAACGVSECTALLSDCGHLPLRSAHSAHCKYAGRCCRTYTLLPVIQFGYVGWGHDVRLERNHTHSALYMQSGCSFCLIYSLCFSLW